MNTADEDYYEAKYQSILNDNREIVSDEFLDYIDKNYPDHNVRTCINSKQIGTLDRYVAWIKPENKPKNLVIDQKTFLAYGSI